MFVDSHAHLEMPQFDADRAEVLQRARAAGIRSVLAIGSGAGPGSLDCAIQLANQHDWAGSPARADVARDGVQIYATVGIHPHEAKLATDADLAELEALARNPKVIAWGEIGLDYWYDHSPRDTQRSVFLKQLELARAAALPVIIHCRPSADGNDAWDDVISALRQHWASSGLGGILHCFTGTMAHARTALDMGFLISFAGNITFPKAQYIRDVATQAPLDRMLIETDSPFLAPVPYRGRRNEPAYVREVARQIGHLLRMLTDEVGAKTTENFYRFFKLEFGYRAI
ncbi:MAG: TatD family hydrolase [Terriglobales bacterium]